MILIRTEIRHSGGAIFLPMLALFGSVTVAQTPSTDITPDSFLPPGNVRTSLPGVIRIYKVGPDGKIGTQPPGYPKPVTDPSKPFEMADDEVPRIHEGIDYSSRDPKGKPTPLEFKAGVFGKVVFARPGIIVVEVDDRGTRVEYLHNSTVADGIEQGKEVTPSTILGKTGNYSPSLNKARQPYKLSGAPIHLHVQAMTKSGQALYPDEVLRFARTEPALRRQPVFFVPMK